MRELSGEPFTFIRAKAVSKNEIIIAASPDEDDSGFPFTRLGRFRNGEWFFCDVDFWVTSLALSGQDVIALGYMGDLVLWSEGSTVIKPLASISIESTSTQRRGPLVAIEKIGDKYMITGCGGQNFWSDDLCKWVPFIEEIFDGIEGEEVDIFKAGSEEYMKNRLVNCGITIQNVAICSKGAFYFCGGKGNLRSVILYWDGERVTSLLPEPERWNDYTYSLNHILVETEDKIWVCGQDGILLVGNASEGFTQDPAAKSNTLYYKLAKFGDRIYIASHKDIYMHDGKVMTPVQINIERADQGAYTIESLDGVLWAVSPKDILRFDGEKWERILWPNND